MKGASVEVRYSHKLLATLLNRIFGGAKCHAKRIPSEWLTSWSDAARRELARGLLDSDGSTAARSRNRLTSHYCTTSRRLADDVMCLLRSLGVRAGIHERKPAPGGIVRGRQIVGRRSSFMVHWPSSALDKREHGIGHRSSLAWGRGLFHEARVTAWKCVARPSWVYDLEMVGHPSFVANGMLVHNSATPVYNMGGELHSVMEFIRPGALGTKTEFKLEHCIGDSEKPGKLKLKDPKAMGTYLRDAGLMIRRTRKDIGREIPKLTRVPHEIDSDQETLKKIEGKAIELAKIIMSKTAAARGQTFQASQELNNLVRQATGIAKAPYVAEFVRMLAASDEKVVVYAWHREVYAILMEQLTDARKDGGDLHPVMYTGSESPKQKQAAKDEFCGGDARVMLMSLRSGAGLDGLQNHCRIGAFAELDWSPGVHEQDEGRIARDGQPDPTLFYYLLSTGGSDPIIADMLGIKRGQIEGIRDPNGAFEHGLDADGQNVRKLAQAYLLKHTKALPSGARVTR